MNICSGGRGNKAHPEIVYETNYCPFCDYMEDKEGEIADMAEDLKDKDHQIQKLKEEIS